MKLTTKILKEMIAEEMNNRVPLKEGCGEEQEVSEGMENITPENLQLVLDAVVKMAGVFGPAIMAAVTGSALYSQIMGRKAEIDQEAGLDEKKDPEAKVRNRGDVLFSAESPSVNDDEDHFPINTEKQARSALSRANQYSSAPPWYDESREALVKKVASAVKNKYPSIDVSPASSKPGKG
jgi:hypothetical protein